MRRAVIGGGLVLAVATSVFVLGADRSEARGVTHRVQNVVNSSVAVEGRAKVAFSCNDSGKYTLKASNIQVINSDHVSPWASPAVGYVVTVQLHSVGSNVAWSTTVPLVQNSTNELFGMSVHGSLTDPTACSAGEALVLENNESGMLDLQGTLS